MHAWKVDVKLITVMTNDDGDDDHGHVEVLGNRNVKHILSLGTNLSFCGKKTNKKKKKHQGQNCF